MQELKTHYDDQLRTYDGRQLASLFAFFEYGLVGPSAVAFRGPCAVDFHHMRDGEDLKAQAQIAGADMLHFIVELFDQSLVCTTVFQRLIASMAAESIMNLAPDVRIDREGDDLWWKDRKLSISVAVPGATSMLVHFAINVTNEGTPVPTAALADWKLDPKTVGLSCLNKIQHEWHSILAARYKVRNVFDTYTTAKSFGGSPAGN